MKINYLQETYFKDLASPRKKKSKEEVMTSVAAVGKRELNKVQIAKTKKYIFDNGYSGNMGPTWWFHDLESFVGEFPWAVNDFHTYKNFRTKKFNVESDQVDDFIKSSIPDWEKRLPEIQQAYKNIYSKEFNILSTDNEFLPFPIVLKEKYLLPNSSMLTDIIPINTVIKELPFSNSDIEKYWKLLIQYCFRPNFFLLRNNSTIEQDFAHFFNDFDGLHLLFVGYFSDPEIRKFNAIRQITYDLSSSINLNKSFNDKTEKEKKKYLKTIISKAIVTTQTKSSTEAQKTALRQILDYTTTDKFIEFIHNFSTSNTTSFLNNFVFLPSIVDSLTEDLTRIKKFLETLFNFTVTIQFKGYYSNDDKNSDKNPAVDIKL